MMLKEWATPAMQKQVKIMEINGMDKIQSTPKICTLISHASRNQPAIAAETIVAKSLSLAPIFLVRSSSRPTKKQGSADANKSVENEATIRSFVQRGISAHPIAMKIGIPPIRGTALT